MFSTSATFRWNLGRPETSGSLSPRDPATCNFRPLALSPSTVNFVEPVCVKCNSDLATIPLFATWCLRRNVTGCSFVCGQYRRALPRGLIHPLLVSKYLAGARRGIARFNGKEPSQTGPNRASRARLGGCCALPAWRRGRFVGTGERSELFAELAEGRRAGQAGLRLPRPGLRVEQAVVLEQLE